jgi:hypothetical protein
MAGMLSDAGMNDPLGAIKLRAGFEEIEHRTEHRRAGGGSGGAVIAAPHPGSETFAANGPGFSVAVCYEIGECDPVGRVKQLVTEPYVIEHIGWRLVIRVTTLSF